MRYFITGLFAMAALAFLSHQARADNPIYSWEDENGVHFVDSLDLVPADQRNAAAEREEEGAFIGDNDGGNFTVIDSIPAEVIVPPSPQSSKNTKGKGDEAAAPEDEKADGKAAEPTQAGGKPIVKDKSYWQNQLQEWRDKQSAAETRVGELDTEIYRTRTLTPANFQQKLADLRQAREVALQEIERAKYMLDEGLPREARKAGIPPGWLR